MGGKREGSEFNVLESIAYHVIMRFSIFDEGVRGDHCSTLRTGKGKDCMDSGTKNRNAAEGAIPKVICFLGKIAKRNLTKVCIWACWFQKFVILFLKIY